MVVSPHYDAAKQRIRIKTVLAFIFFFCFVVVCRLFYLQVLRHDYYLKVASTQHWAQDVIQAERGKIYVKDETSPNGLYPLATNQKLNLVFASPQEMISEKKKTDKRDETAEKISPILGEDAGKIKKLFKDNHTYVPLKHGVKYEDVQRIKELNLDGIYFRDEDSRFYPESTLASQLLGFVNDEGVGNYGIEQYFDDELAGTPGLYKAEIDPSGKRIAFGSNVSVKPKDGTDFVLTINRDVQAKAEEVIKESVEKFSAKSGSVIVMDPNTGEVIAMANYPTYDPNKYKEVREYKLFKNLSVTDEYEPGSIFKAITAAAGLDTGKIEPDTKYDDTGVVTVDGHKIMNSDKKANGIQTMTNVLEKSLNTGVIYIMDQIGKNVFYEYIKKLGFGFSTGIEQPTEGTGRVYAPNEVNNHTYDTITFGQSISTTPIQMITSFAAIANGGKLVRPHLIAEKIVDGGKKVVSDNRPIKDVFSGETSAKAREMLVSVVENGHGQQAKVAGYKVGGKTGTAQVPLANGLGYDPKSNIGSFVGFGPAESPRFVVLSKVDSPKGVPWAESSAAPVVGKMLDFLFKYYQVPPTEPIK